MKPHRLLAALLPALLLTLPALAQPGVAPEAAEAAAATAETKIDTGDTAWMLVSKALVTMMTIPGLAFFYAGMVRKKNVLATMMQSFTITALVTVIWMVAGAAAATPPTDTGIGSRAQPRPRPSTPSPSSSRKPALWLVQRSTVPSALMIRSPLWSSGRNWWGQALT